MRSDTEATVELWQEQAIHNLQAAEDFKLELSEAMRELCRLQGERDLADRLADALLSTLSSWMTSPDSENAAQALAAWKEARSECR